MLLLLLGCVSRPADEGFIDGAGGVRLHYALFGHGADTVVVLHGGPGLSTSYLVELLRPLGTKHTVIFFDQRGRGRSTAPEAPTGLTLAADVSDLDALVRHFRLGRFSVVAHHYGAMLAAAYDRRSPGRIRRAVLFSPLYPHHVYLYDLTFDTLDSRFVARYRAARDKAQQVRFPERYCRSFWGLYFSPANVTDPDALRGLADQICDDPPDALRRIETVNHQVISSLGAWDWRDSLRSFRPPALVIQGGGNPTLLHSGRSWAHYVGDGRILISGRVALFPWWNDGGRAFQAADQFLAGDWPPEAEIVSSDQP